MRIRETREGSGHSLMHRFGRKALAVMLSASMLLSSVNMPMALAAGKTEDQTAQTGSSLSPSVAELLKIGEKEYPDGAFGLANTQIQMTEGDKDQVISVVRMGDANKDASVIFHMIDVSAKYGQDYELYVMEDGKKKILTDAEGNQSLMEKYGDQLLLKTEEELEKEAQKNGQTPEAKEAAEAKQAAEAAGSGLPEGEDVSQPDSAGIQSVQPGEDVLTDETAGIPQDEAGKQDVAASQTAKKGVSGSQAADEAEGEDSQEQAEAPPADESLKKGAQNTEEAPAADAASGQDSKTQTESPEADDAGAQDLKVQNPQDETAAPAVDTAQGGDLQESQDPKDSQESQDPQAVPADDASGDQSGAASRATDLIGSDTTIPANGLNSLERAQAVQKGMVEKNKGWREISDEKTAEYQEADKVISEGYENLEKAIKDLGGLTYEVKFAAGENTKEIFVHVPDDNVSDGEVQAMFGLTDGLGGVLSDSRDGYLNIRDNEKSEAPAYSFAKKKVSVNAGQESVTLTVKKTKGTESISTVTVIATDGTGVSNEIYEPYAESLVFAPGCKSKEITIPLVKTADPEKAVNFYVGIGKEDGKTDRDAGLAEVVVNPNPATAAPSAKKGASLRKGASSPKGAGPDSDSKNGWINTDSTTSTRYINFDQWECHARDGKGYGPNPSDSKDYIELRNATKLRYYYFNDWHHKEGRYSSEFGVLLGNGERINISGTSAKTTSGKKTVRARDTKGNFNNINVDYKEFTLSDSARAKIFANGDKGCKFYCKIYRDCDYANCNLTRVEIDYTPINIVTNNENAKVNFYYPKTYDGYTGVQQRHGIFLGKTLMRVWNSSGDTMSDTIKDFKTHPGYYAIFGWEPTGETNEDGIPTTKDNIVPSRYYVEERGDLKEYNMTSLNGGTGVKSYAPELGRFQDKDRNVKIITGFEPKKLTVVFKNGDGVQFNKYTEDKQLKISSLDTVRLSASPTKKNYAVAGFSANMKILTRSKPPLKGLLIAPVIRVDTKPVQVKYDPGRKDSGVLDLSNVDANAIIEVTPLAEPLSLTVMVDPATAKNAEKDKNTADIISQAQVLFTPDGDSKSEPGTGDWKHEMKVPDVEMDGRYTIIGNTVTDKDGKPIYEYVWRNGSADTNGDGIFSAEEKQNYYGSSTAEVETFRGNAYPFTIMKAGASKIYYNLESVNKNKEPADTGGQVSFEEPVLSTGKRKKTYVNGVTVTGFGEDTLTKDTGKNAYLLNGGSGFYLLSSDVISRYGRYLLNYNFIRDDGSTLRANMVASPGDYKELKFMADSVMKVEGLDLEVMSDKFADAATGDLNFTPDDYEKISDTAFFYVDSDRQHKISFRATSTETSLQPKQVVIRFRKKNGEEITKIRKTVDLGTADAGAVEYEFTPEKLEGTNVGTYLTIQIIDQLGRKYPEQDTGYVMHKSMGRKELDSTFAFGAGTAIKIVGLVFGQGGEGWSGRLDEHSANVKVGSRKLSDEEYKVLDMEYRDAQKANKEDIMARLDEQMQQHQNGEKTMKTMTLCIGMDLDVYEDKNSEGTVDDFAKDKAAKDVALAKKTKEYSEALLDPRKTTDDAKKAKEAMDKAKEEADKAKNDYESAVDKKANKEETIKSFASSVKISVGYTYMITFDYDRAAQTWYFEKMMLTMKGAGEYSADWKFATPVGVTIGLGFKVSGTLELSIIMKATPGHKYYLTDVEGKKRLDGDDDKVNFIAFISNITGDAMDYEGAAGISPNIELHASASVASIEVKASGSVGLEMGFFTDPEEKNAGSVKLSAKIGVEVFFLSASWTFHADPISIFGGDDKSVDEMLAGDAYLYGSGDRFGMIEMPDVGSRKGWQGSHPISLKAIDENPDGVAAQLLQSDIYAGTEPKLMKINEQGDYLGVFLDADGSRENKEDQAAVFYSIYDSGSRQWSKPAVLEDDGLLDSDVNIADLGERGLIVTWSATNKSITPEMSNIDKMNCMDLHGAFFDKDKEEFTSEEGKTKILEITRETTGTFSDDYSDQKANVITDGNEMIIYYSKNSYEVSEGTKEAVGDVVWPSVTYKVYRTYRFAKASGTEGTFVEDYADLKDKSIKEDIMSSDQINHSTAKYQQYVQGFYGQVFPYVAPDVYVEETMDDADEYWEEGSSQKIYLGTEVKGQLKKEDAPDSNASIIADGTDVSGTDDQEVAARYVPYIVDSDMISYNDLGIFAYTMDYDNDLTTVNDRDIYFQIYDFRDGSMLHPIMVTADNVQDGNVRLFREAYTNAKGEKAEATMLSWLHDGLIQTIDLSNVVKNLGEPKKANINGEEVPYYLIEKTQEAGYIPPRVIADSADMHRDNATAKGNVVENSEEEAKQADAISGFDVYSNGGYTWYVWTDHTTKLNEGIDPNGADASDPANHKLETQLYMVRHDLKEDQLTEPVQITSEEGANYENASVVVNGDGTLGVLAKKSMSHLVDAAEFNGQVDQINATLPENEQQDTVPEKEFIPFSAVNAKKDLVSLRVNPVSKAKLKETENLLDDLNAGETMDFSFDILNDGVDTLSGLRVTGTDGSGSGVLITEKETKNAGGETETILELTDTLHLDDIIGGKRVTIYGNVTTKETDPGCAITLTLKDKDGKVLDTKKVEKTFKEEFAITDLTVGSTVDRDVFDASCEVKNIGSKGSAENTLTFGIKTKDGKDNALATLTVPALTPGESTTVQLDRFDLDSASFFVETPDENGGVIEKGTFYATAGGARNENDFIRDSSEHDKKAIDQVTSIDIGNGAPIEVAPEGRAKTDLLVNKKSMLNRETRTKDLTTIFESSDPTIFDVDQEGTIYGLKEGSAKLIAYVLPANTIATATISANGGEDAPAQLGEEDKFAGLPNSLIKKAEVTVNVKTPAAPPTSKKQGGVTYKISGSSVTVAKADSTVKTANIPATMNIGGKNYKVTSIGKAAFKNCKKLSKLTIGGNVTTIGTSAFENCTALTKVKIPNSVTKIGGNAFKNCKKMTSLTIGGKVKSIGTAAFMNCVKIKKVTIPKKVTSIGKNAFRGDKKLASIVFKPSKAPKTGSNAFKSIAKKAVFKVPKKPYKSYKKKLGKKAGVTGKMKVKKY